MRILPILRQTAVILIADAYLLVNLPRYPAFLQKNVKLKQTVVFFFRPAIIFLSFFV